MEKGGLSGHFGAMEREPVGPERKRTESGATGRGLRAGGIATCPGHPSCGPRCWRQRQPFCGFRSALAPAWLLAALLLSGVRLAAARDFLHAELLEAYRLAGYPAAVAHERPVAVWIVGPSAVGKSTNAGAVASLFGVGQRAGASSDPRRAGGGKGPKSGSNSSFSSPFSSLFSSRFSSRFSSLFSSLFSSSSSSAPSALSEDSDAAPASGPDAVTVDGDHFRRSHGAYMSAASGSDWRDAYPRHKKVFNLAKATLVRNASLAGKHLLLPDTCLHPGDLRRQMSDLRAAGYVNHVAVLTASRRALVERGQRRALVSGKRYLPEEIDVSVRAIPSVVEQCNGDLVRVHVGWDFQVSVATARAHCSSLGPKELQNLLSDMFQAML